MREISIRKEANTMCPKQCWRIRGALHAILALLLILAVAASAGAQSLMVRLEGESDGDEFGEAVIMLPDGRIIVGAPGVANVPGDFPLMHGALYSYTGPWMFGGVTTSTALRLHDQNLGVHSEGFGRVLASVGDINNDNESDFVAGVPGDTVGGVSSAGRAYLFIKNIPVELQHPAPLAGERVGWVASPAGDFNGDDFPDFVVGSNESTSGSSGRAFVYFGQTMAPPPISLSPSIEILHGGAGLGQPDFASALTHVRDLDGDGRDEIAIAAGSENRVYVFLGRQVPSPPMTLTALGNADLTIIGQSGETFGHHIDASGDLDGDGLPDLLVSTNLASGFKRTYVFYHATLANAIPSGVLNAASDADVILRGPELFTRPTLYVGDVDGDGRSDIVTRRASSPENEVMVMLSHTSLTPAGTGPHFVEVIDLASWRGTFRLRSDGGGTGFGYRNRYGNAPIAGGVDLNADGKDNFAIGDAGWINTDGDAVGAVYVYGSYDFVLQNATLEADPNSAITPAYTGSPYASAVLDANEDGVPDLVIAMHVGTGEVLQGGVIEGAYRVLNRTSQWMLDSNTRPASASRSFAIADIDNNGSPDVFVAHATSPKLLRYDGASGTFLDGTAVLGVTDGASSAAGSWSGSWGDYDRDGWVDLLIARAGGSDSPSGVTASAPRLLRNTLGVGGTSFELVTDASAPGAIHVAATSSLWLDIDEDGYLDAVLPTLSSSGSSLLYKNLGGETFEEVWGSSLPSFNAISSVTPVVGHPGAEAIENGLLFTRREAGSGAENLMVFLNSSGTFTDATTALVQPRHEEAAAYAHTADFDLDGLKEVVVQPFATGNAHVLAPPSGPGAWMDLHGAGVGPSAAGGTSVADFDLDGDPDLFLGRPPRIAVGFPNEFYQETRADFETPVVPARVLVVRVQGSDGNNRYGIGTKVSVHNFSGYSRTEWIHGGRGRAGQSLPEVSFGLAGVSAQLLVTVVWPDGFTQTDVVPSTSSGRQVITFRDDHVPELVAGTLSASWSYGPQSLVDVVVEWESNRATPGTRDRVVITPLCDPTSVRVIEYAQGDTPFVKRLASGRYLHRVTATQIIACHPACTYEIVATSAVRSWDAVGDSFAVKSESLSTTKLVKICVSE